MQTITQKKIWLSSPHMGKSEQEYVRQAFESNWVAPLGPNVDGFENALELYVGNNINVACLSSGTAAIHLALSILGVGQGDKVLCQSFTFAGSANPITYLGATPVFIDSERESWNICPSLLEKAIKDSLKEGVKPKAILAVHLFGMPYKVKEIETISKKYEIPVIEDSAEALGSSYYGVKCGGFGDIGILSFNGNKIITTSGGGALLAKSKEVRDQAVYLATQARDAAPHYEHSQIGFNYRMSNILAGIGRGQMEVLDDRVKARRSNYDFYKKRLGNIKRIGFLDEPEGFFSNRWLTCILTESYHMREQIRLALNESNIECRPLWKPMHIQPVFQSVKAYKNGVSEDLFNRGLCLPSGSNLQVEDLERIVGIIEGILRC